ncbi:TniQ family protein [Aquabacterium sp.]|uniref:TniQ family protein n=1 Tax=Aquabacterium sp. TaxID=1872578 RepID=UPI003412B609
MNDCLPILAKPREDESATGFLTRAFAMNRTRAMTVYRWLGLSWTSQLKHCDLPALARATDMPVNWFTHRVPVELPTGRWHWSWLGQQWKGHQTVRAPGQRLCPSCVHCPRRSKSEPLCRSNIEPGLVADQRVVSCG